MCTSIQMKSADGGLLFARTMDWHTYNAGALLLPQKYSWTSVYSGQKVTNLYAILGVGNLAARPHADISDGVNEHGLAVQKLTFSNQSEYADHAQPSKIQLAAFELVLWLLGNCRSVADIRQKISQVQLMTDQFSAFKFGRNDLHFSATDPTGQMINIEPCKQGELLVSDNPIGVVTNAPKFDREIEKLSTYMDFKPLTEITSANSLNPNQVSTGNFNGKPVFPGGFTPTSRFIRASVLKERAIFPENEHENVIETWHILNSVTVPKSSGRSGTYTIYRSAVEVNSRKLYLQTYNDFSIQVYQFPDA
ncbi:choloylglycine hydrolase family protein [Lactococcus kimchii]|uniref:choloylglycine hydrolase family protein n=1 Tax=Lactococcus sp. S-13 TaxID=2507158 RepID=UPI001022F569|nr:choloylglycine hydrolase family protein [Lactococcus sp. S-13]RZI48203.1 choloylglycine hydrolase family protein [Lactococcus sp. S-13]